MYGIPSPFSPVLQTNHSGLDIGRISSFHSERLTSLPSPTWNTLNPSPVPSDPSSLGKALPKYYMPSYELGTVDRGVVKTQQSLNSHFQLRSHDCCCPRQGFPWWEKSLLCLLQPSLWVPDQHHLDTCPNMKVSLHSISQCHPFHSPIWAPLSGLSTPRWLERLSIGHFQSVPSSHTNDTQSSTPKYVQQSSPLNAFSRLLEGIGIHWAMFTHSSHW